MNKIFLCGDLHGDSVPYYNFISRNKIDDKDYVIFLGDFCANYFLNKRDNRFKQEMNEMPGIKIVLRGNHESRIAPLIKKRPEDWEFIFYQGRNQSKVQLDEEEAYNTLISGFFYHEKNYPKIWYMKDEPAIYMIGGKKVLILPGAYSVDKYYRIENHLRWFEDEQMSQEEIEELRGVINKPFKVDAILSHTCPLKYEPKDLFIPSIQQSSVDKTMEKFFDEIDNKLKPRVWAFGHFHEYREYPPHKDGRYAIMLFNDKLVEWNELFDTEIDYLTTY